MLVNLNTAMRSELDCVENATLHVNSCLTASPVGSVVQLAEVDGDQGFAIVAARARQAMTLDEGASGFGGYAKAFGHLSVGELFGRHD